MVCTVRCAQHLAPFKHVFSAPRELWIIMLLKLLESFAYFSSSINFVLYLSREFGYSDIEAGTYYGIWGVLISVYGLASGALIDKLGVKYSLVLGGLLTSAGRALFALATSRRLLLLSIFFISPLGMSLAIPVMSIGIKRVTSKENRSLSYGIFYSQMNIGALLSGTLTDVLNRALSDECDARSNVDCMSHSSSITPMRYIFLIGTVISIVYTLIAACFFRNLRLNVQGQVVTQERDRISMWQNVRSTLHDSMFWRLMLFTSLLTCVNMVFRTMDTSFPKYLLRAVDSEALYGSIYSINPFMIIFLAPLFQALFAQVDPYRCILVGSFISAASVFALALGAHYWNIVLFVVLLSFGEATYSPRVYDYVLLLSPHGQEGLYATLSAAPMFVAKLFIGVLSGELLEMYCPAEPPRQCWKMWFIIGLVTMSSPLLLLVCKSCIHTVEVKQRIRLNDRNSEVEMELQREIVDAPEEQNV